MRHVVLVLATLFVVLPGLASGGEHISFTWTNVQVSYDSTLNVIWAGGQVSSPEASVVGNNVELLSRPGDADQAWSSSTIGGQGGFFFGHGDPGNGAQPAAYGLIAWDDDGNWGTDGGLVTFP